MGFKQIVGSNDYVRFECPAGEATFSLHRVKQVAADTCMVVCFDTPDLDAQVSRWQAAGILFTQLPRDERWLWH